MNVQQAARQLESAARAYAARTPEGRFRVPREAQRPVYLIGPPGVGKTAVVAQVARKLGIGYAAYTMTHHTRQSAVGLPMIAHRTLGGVERAVTEYTMSEIVAAVWAQAEAGAVQGILFLDEINCASESLMPAMLQLLQYKTFGVHALPEGWMIVCAGNPPKYNRYAHTFDPVVLDRLRVIEVEPDLAAWRAYAAARGVHPAVRSWLALREADFYATDGDRIVTARSWTDLSDVMLALEAVGETPDAALFGQYLQLPEVAERFGLYHRLCVANRVGLDAVLEGGEGMRFGLEAFDEALFAAMLLSGRLETQAGQLARDRRRSERLTNFAQAARAAEGDVQEVCRGAIERQEAALAARKRAGALDADEEADARWLLAHMREGAMAARTAGPMEARAALVDFAATEARTVDTAESACALAFERAFDYVEGSIADPNVRLIFLNDLHDCEASRRFIARTLQPRFDALWAACDPDRRMASPDR